MSLIDDGHTPKRRRGEALEVALLDAAWAELSARGYADFTIDAVAERAGTSRAVLYRRWPGKRELIAAAARHAMMRDRGAPPVLTGPLRDDLIAMLTWVNRMTTPTLIELALHLSPYLAEEAMTFGDFRSLMIGPRGSQAPSVIQLAIDRGEIDAARVTPRIAALPFDLFRNELLMTGRPMTEDVIREVVDDIVLPLLTGRPRS